MGNEISMVSLKTQEVIELCVSLHKEVESLEKMMDSMKIDVTALRTEIAVLKTNYKTHLKVYHSDSNLKRREDDPNG